MKKLSLLLIVLLLFALPAMSEPLSDGAGESRSTPTVEQVRYHFEHRTLPTYFYEQPESMLNAIKMHGIYALWESIRTENGVVPAYAAEDYVEHWYSSDDDTIIVQVEMPEPEANTLCERIYFVYNAESDNTAYFTVEYDNLLGKSNFLCGWTREHDHVNYGSLAPLDRSSADYEEALRAEAEQIAEMAGASPTLIPADIAIPESAAATSSDESQEGNLSLISCPEQGFTTMADPSYAWEYVEGDGITIWTEHKGYIPYVLVWAGEDLIAEPMDYIHEQYTPYMQKQYGDDLLDYREYETYNIGGKLLPAGLYRYKSQGHEIDLLRLYDSTGDRTVAFTAKYLKGEGAATLDALETAIYCFEEGGQSNSQGSRTILSPMDVSEGTPDTQNGTYWAMITDTDKIFDGGFFTASLYEQDRYTAAGVEGLNVGDHVRVNGQFFTVSALNERDDGTIEMIPEEDFEGYIAFRNQGDYYLAMMNDWIPVSFVADYKVMLPLPDAFSYIEVESSEDTRVYDWESFVSLITGSDAPILNPYNTAIGFQDGLVMTIVHTDYPEGPSA